MTPPIRDAYLAGVFDANGVFRRDGRGRVSLQLSYPEVEFLEKVCLHLGTGEIKRAATRGSKPLFRLVISDPEGVEQTIWRMLPYLQLKADLAERYLKGSVPPLDACSRPDCEKRRYSHGLCATHWRQWLRATGREVPISRVLKAWEAFSRGHLTGDELLRQIHPRNPLLREEEQRRSEQLSD